MPFMYVLYYPYYVYSNSFVLSYILEQLLDPLRSGILIHMYSKVDILGYPLLFCWFHNVKDLGPFGFRYIVSFNYIGGVTKLG